MSIKNYHLTPILYPKDIICLLDSLEKNTRLESLIVGGICLSEAHLNHLMTIIKRDKSLKKLNLKWSVGIKNELNFIESLYYNFTLVYLDIIDISDDAYHIMTRIFERNRKFPELLGKAIILKSGITDKKSSLYQLPSDIITLVLQTLLALASGEIGVLPKS